MFKGTLIMSGNNAKTIKGDGTEFETAIMYLAPADLATKTTLCPMAILAGCKAGCLNTAGRGGMNSVQTARARKARWYENDRGAFMSALVEDIRRFEAYCKRKGVKPVVRLNGTSDIPFERIPVASLSEFDIGHDNIMAAYPGVQFYDYTKTARRVLRELPENYSLVVSWSGASERYWEDVTGVMLSAPNVNVAVVFRDKQTVNRFKALGFLGRRVVDGDESDLRFLDDEGVIVALYAKGAAKRDQSGFVVD